MEILVLDEADIPPELDAQIRTDLCLCFPDDAEIYRQTRGWHGAVPAYTVIGREAGRVVAHVGVVDRTITVGGTPLRVAGVESVYVLPEYRGQRRTGSVLVAAIEEANRRQLDCGLLFCLPELAKVYTACGWHALGPRPIIRAEDGQELPLPAKNMALFHPLRVPQFPEGLIHLGGNDW
jgi:GNAT superfamily N-acetyltransferase